VFQGRGDLVAVEGWVEGYEDGAEFEAGVG
jgi:hypothetical protein